MAKKASISAAMAVAASATKSEEDESASAVFEKQFDEVNKKVAEAKAELEQERLKRQEEQVMYEQKMSTLEAER